MNESPYYNYLLFENATAECHTFVESYHDCNALKAGNYYVLFTNINTSSESLRYDAFGASWMVCRDFEEARQAYLQGRMTDPSLGIDRGGGWTYYGSFYNYGWDRSLVYHASQDFNIQGSYTSLSYSASPIQWNSFDFKPIDFQNGLITGLAHRPYLFGKLKV